MKARIFLGLAIVCSLLVSNPIPADAATSNTPVWIGAGFDGFYREGAAMPGKHVAGGGGDVAFDYFGPAGRTVRIYAAPKNNDYNDQITAHIIKSVPGFQGARLCGWRTIVEIQRNGNPIGTVSFSHLEAQVAEGKISRWGGVVGKIGDPPLNSGADCYDVSTTRGRHVHIEFNSYGSRPACAHNWGAISIPATRYQGYIGDYGKAPINKGKYGYLCPSGI